MESSPPHDDDRQRGALSDDLAAIVTASHDGIYSIDLQGIITSWNPGAERLYGYSPSEAIGRSFAMLIPEDRRGEEAAILERIAAGGQIDHYETRRVRKDGTFVDVSLSISAIRDPSGTVTRASIIVRDITEIKRARDSLRASEERNRLILENSGDAYIAIDEASVVTEWNRRAEEFFGYPPHEVVGTPLYETVIPERYRSAHLDGLTRFLDTGEGPLLGRPVEVEALRRDGTEFPIELVIWPLEIGGVFSFHAFVRDISERKTAEAALEEQAALLDLAQDAIIARDAADSITYWSRGAEERYGWSKQEALGRSSHELLRTEFPQSFAQIESELLGAGRWEGELVHRRRDGSEIVLASRWALRRDELGNPYQVLEINNDITAQKQAERAMHAAREEADRANLAKSEFLSRMSHELRTPLNAILGFAQLLDMDELTPEQRDSTEQILKGGRRLLDLINEVLDISRIESGTLRLSLEPVGVADVVQDSIDLIRPLAEERGIRLHAELPASMAEQHVRADRQRLGQVLLNLLSNAVKYNVEEGTVTVTCAHDGDEAVRIGVTDTGPGVAPDKIPLLFVPFERLGGETTSVEGTGLGLALCKSLVEAMDGRITVDTMMGEGTTFWIELPKAKAPLAEPAPAEVRTEPAPAGSLTVLYVEDNLSNLRLIERLLARRADVEMISAMTANLGMDLARQHVPDLILLDLHLPDVRGDEVLTRLRRDPRTAHIPVVILSADATPGEIKRLLAAGAEDYLTKPLDVPSFMRVLDRILERAG